MTFSIIVAKIISVIYLSVGFAVLNGRLNLRKMTEDYERSPGLLYIGSMCAIIVGMLIVVNHNIWVQDWTVLITIVGWAALIKGILLMAFPQTIGFFKNLKLNSQAWGIFIFALGLMFGYFGFIAAF